MLLGTLGVSLLGNMLAGRGKNRAGEEVIKAAYGNKKGKKTRSSKQKGYLIPPHPLTNFEIQKHLSKWT